MANHPRFQLTTGKDSQHRFTLTAANGQVILTSEGYSAKSGAKNGIASVKKNAGDDGRYDRKVAKNGKHFFNLLAGNKQIIGTSQMYASKASMENGIESVKNNAAKAEVHED